MYPLAWACHQLSSTFFYYLSAALLRAFLSFTRLVLVDSRHSFRVLSSRGCHSFPFCLFSHSLQLLSIPFLHLDTLPWH